MAWKCIRPQGGRVVEHGRDLASTLVLLPSEHGCSSEAMAVSSIIFSHVTPSLLDTHACSMVPWQLSVTLFFHLCLAICSHPWCSKLCLSLSIPLELSVITWGPHTCFKQIEIDNGQGGLLRNYLFLSTSIFSLHGRLPLTRSLRLHEQFWCWRRSSGCRCKCLWQSQRLRVTACLIAHILSF